MLYPPIDPNERFRARRAAARRRKRARRAVLAATLLAAVALVGVGAQLVGREPAGERRTEALPAVEALALATPEDGPRPLPLEIRGVHVTMGLASLPGKLDEYLALAREGLTALELDVKDESGHVGFLGYGIPSLAREIGAARGYYDARATARKVHARGLYLIGRVVLFEDPLLSTARPDLAVRRPDGSVWRDAAGLGWTNPYDRRVWKYNVDIAVAAARAGFDEIMFDYVRFPSDGDVGSAVYAGRGSLPKRDVIPAFLRYARSRLERFDVRISAAVFGLSAARDLGIGQLPGRMAPYLDLLYPMTYPSHFGPGELGVSDPSASPGETVARALARFRARLAGHDVLIAPWVQDFSFATPYGLAEVRAQIEAARLAGAKGFLLWNAEGIYTKGALAPS
ncbi:MAG: putative glycoside hydrolase [Thermoleophilia bacterium]|nr:putative glycoside hydrolase [Gaiellaceae bacterium]MDW8338963.1 putative glycoside hydrolase [Thermoleophilia bacterium]